MYTEDKICNHRSAFNYIVLLSLVALLLIGRMLMIKINLDYQYFNVGLIMFIFALITSISLIVTAFITSKIKGNNQIIKYISFLIIIALGIQFISHGLSCINKDNSKHMSLNNTIYEKISK